ncbi:MAG: hypothetical protein ACLRWM_16110 [Streptococcus sp.]
MISGDADYVTKLQLYINSNTLPDIYGCANGALSAAAKDIGGIVNIGDELERVGKKDDMNAAVYDFFKDKDDGNVYLFPEALNCEFSSTGRTFLKNIIWKLRQHGMSFWILARH